MPAKPHVNNPAKMRIIPRGISRTPTTAIVAPERMTSMIIESVVKNGNEENGSNGYWESYSIKGLSSMKMWPFASSQAPKTPWALVVLFFAFPSRELFPCLDLDWARTTYIYKFDTQMALDFALRVAKNKNKTNESKCCEQRIFDSLINIDK